MTDSRTLRRGYRARGPQAEYFLIKDFPKKRLTKAEIEQIEELLRGTSYGLGLQFPRRGYFEGGQILSDEQETFLKVVLENYRE